MQLTINEEEELIKLFSLLKDTHSARRTEMVKNAREELSSVTSNILSLIKIVIKGLSVTNVRNIKISLELHKSLLIYLKNILLINQRNINDPDIYNYLKDIFTLMLTVTDNENIQCDSMVILFQNLIKTICDNNSMISNTEYVEKLFKLILDKVTSANDKEFLLIAKNSLGLISSLFTSNSFNQENYLDFYRKYFIPITDTIFSKVYLYINPNNNIYEINFIIILENLFETFYSYLLKMKRFFPSLKRKEIADEIIIKYGKYTFEIIKLMPLNDEKTKIQFGETNPIIVFNENFEEMNHMKASAFKFIELIIQFSTMSSIKDENQNNSDNNNNDILDDKRLDINNNELIDISSKLITLIVNSFENILNDEKKFNYLRKIDDETSDEENWYNMLLYHIIHFLVESLIRNPIRKEFSQHIKIFLLNVLFPMLITVQSEFKYMRIEPEEYCAYFNDLMYNFTLKNFRISGLFLIKKLCEYYEDIPNFILSYFIGMTNDIINKEENNINDIKNKYNAYYFYKSQNVLIDKLSEDIKLDFCLLILILLQNELLKYDTLKNKLREILIKSQNKFDQIKGPLIKIKFCHLFKFIIPNIYNEKISQKEEEDINNENDNQNKINIETDIELNSINNLFIEKALSFLFNNLTQSKSEEYLSQSLYYHSLGNEASDTIIFLSKLTQNEDNKNESLKNILNNLFQKYFYSLLELIDVINLYSFFNVIEQIIKYIKINDREVIFICLDKLTKRFEKENNTGDINSQIYCPLYFSIISNFFKGVNKIDINSKIFQDELEKFDNIYKTVLDQMKDIYRFLYYENLVKAMVDYIEGVQGINESSSFVLNSFFNIIENERTFSETSFTFVSTFLFYLQNNVSKKYIDQNKLFETIVEIIQKSFEIDPDEHDYSNLYALILTLQIYNKNMNTSENISKILLSNSVRCFNFIFQRDEKNGIAKEKKDKDLIIFGIMALGYIFKPEQTYTLLQQSEIIKKKEKKGLYEEDEFELFDFDKYIDILTYINEFEMENELLRKCLILGFCSIFKFEKLKEYLSNNKTLKVKLLKIFSEFILMHKEQDIKTRNKLMKNELKEIKTNENRKIEFENEESEYEEEEEESKNILDKRITYILESNENIKNSDEYLFFKETLDNIKISDVESINMLNKELPPEKIKQLEEVYHMKKYKINYQGKEIEIPRRIINIKRNYI